MLLTTSRTGLCSYRQVMRACMICTAVLLGFAFAGCGQQDDHLQQGSRSGTGSTSTTGTVADDTTSAGTDEAVNAYRGPETRQVTITETVDGDSVQIQPAIEGRTDLRLVGVDTPELASARGDSGEPLAEEAATFTEGELAGEQVTLILAEDPGDPYGRLLGTSLPKTRAPTAKTCCARATLRHSSTSQTLSTRCSTFLLRRTRKSAEPVCGGCLRERVASW